MFSRTCTWLTPSEVELDRVFGGHDVGFRRVDLGDRRIERVGLAAAGRPGDEHHAPRPQNRRSRTSSATPARSRACVMSSISLSLSSRRMTIFSPNSVGRHETRKSISLVRAVVAEADLDAAVLRQALLGDVELRHDLDARGDRVAELHRRRHDVVEDAVDAVADAAAPSRTARCGCRSRPSESPTSARRSRAGRPALPRPAWRAPRR